MKSIAIMQPYFFPYIGYYQLFSAVDTFVFLDDVSFRKKSYINRNSLNYHGKELKFSLSVNRISQNRNINEHEYIDPFTQIFALCDRVYKKKELKINYQEFLQENIFFDEQKNVSVINQRTITSIAKKLGLNINILKSSELPRNPEEKGQKRILSICKYLEADRYINLPGGKELYHPEKFAEVGIKLNFIKTEVSPPYYSYLDLFILEDYERQNTLLDAYHLTD